MRMNYLRVRNFRGFSDFQTGWGPLLNVVWGGNAVGKSNLMEAIYLLATGWPLRAQRDAELIRLGEETFFLKAGLEGRHRLVEVELYYKDGGKHLRLNGQEQGLVRALYSLFPVVSFSPDDLLVLKGSPLLRRQLLDRLLCQVSKVYRRLLLDYRHALAQRNAQLRLLRDERTATDTLDTLGPWDEQLCELASHLLKHRQQAIEELKPVSEKTYAYVAASSEGFEMSYVPGIPPALLGAGEDELRRLLRDELRRSVRLDVERGFTSLGPHRDDILVRLGGLDARAYASQGQIRSAVLALKMAEVEFLRQRTGEIPLLILDDVFSELDEARKDRLLDWVRGLETQTFITCSQNPCDLMNLRPEDTLVSLDTIGENDVPVRNTGVRG